MEVIRKVKKEVKKMQVGDQIVLGRYTATCMTVDETGATFCFDQVYGETAMKRPWDQNRANTLYRSKAMDNVRDFLVPFVDQDVQLVFRSPTAEELVSKQFLRPIVPTTIAGADKRWDAAKKGSYRLGVTVDGMPCAYWLDSTVNSESSACRNLGPNCFFDIHGRMAFTNIDYENHLFWRPVFKLKV